MKQITYQVKVLNPGTNIARAIEGMQVNASGEGLNAAVFLPNDYDQDVTKKWPLVVSFGGRGEASKDWIFANLLKNGLPKLAKNGIEFPFILYALQDRWSSPAPGIIKYSLINTVLKQYRIDEKQIIFSGYSFGGGASLAAGLALPELCAGVVSASTSALQPTEVTNLPKFDKSIEVVFWNGTKDTSGPYAENIKQYMTILQAAGVKVSLVTEPVGHGPWDNLYNGKTLLNGKTFTQFVLEHRKGGVVQPPVVVPDPPKEPETPPVTQPPVVTPPQKKLIETINLYDDGTFEKKTF